MSCNRTVLLLWTVWQETSKVTITHRLNFQVVANQQSLWLYARQPTPLHEALQITIVTISFISKHVISDTVHAWETMQTANKVSDKHFKTVIIPPKKTRTSNSSRSALSFKQKTNTKKKRNKTTETKMKISYRICPSLARLLTSLKQLYNIRFIHIMYGFLLRKACPIKGHSFHESKQWKSYKFHAYTKYTSMYLLVGLRWLDSQGKI